jgi:hypothetical protein
MYILISFFLVLGRVEFCLPTAAMSSGFICLVSVSGQGELGIEMEIIFCSLHGEAKDDADSDGDLDVSAAHRVRLVVLSLLAIGVENMLLPDGGFWVKVVSAVDDFGSFCRVTGGFYGDGRLLFPPVNLGDVVADIRSSFQARFGSGSRLPALAASPCVGTHRRGRPVGGAPASVKADGGGILRVCALEGLECNLLSFRGLCVAWGALFQY